MCYFSKKASFAKPPLITYMLNVYFEYPSAKLFGQSVSRSTRCNTTFRIHGLVRYIFTFRSNLFFLHFIRRF